MTDWNKFLAENANGNIAQTLNWGFLKSGYGWEYGLVDVRSDLDSILGGALILYKRLPLGFGTIAYIPRGPVFKDWSNKHLLKDLMKKIKIAADAKKAVAVWIEPELFDSAENRKILSELGYKSSSRTIQPPRTILIDLTGSEQDILSRMNQKTRYNIRLAEKKGITVRQASRDIKAFYDLMVETGNRNRFGIHSVGYYRDCLNLFSEVDLENDSSSPGNPKSILFLAEYDSHPLAAVIVLAIGKKATYFYGGTSDEHRDKMPAYAIQWHAIRWAKSQGCALYDLWGIPDEDTSSLESNFTQRTDGLWGVYRFKRGFGGTVVRYVGLWEMPISPFYPPLIKLWQQWANYRNVGHGNE